VSVAAAPGAGARRQAFIERLTGMGFALPAFLLLLLLHIVPLLVLAVLSLTDYQFGALSFRFVGLDNFAAALEDETFRRSLANTFRYVAIVVPGSVGFGLLLAILVHGRGRSRGIYEVIFFLPVTATLIAMASVWKFLLHPTLGPINAFIVMLGFQPVNFLSDPAWALPTLAVIGVWQLVGFNMVLFLAGLSTIPKDLYEAADMDGAAGGVDRFLTVTWPMLGPTTMFVVITSSITAFKVFDTVVAMTRGAPQGSTEVILYVMYLEGFQYFNTAYAAALTLVFLAFILVFSGVQTYFIDRKVHY
jgi:multiple sugar transport system permease protein